jgi:hypothetical protein
MLRYDELDLIFRFTYAFLIVGNSIWYVGNSKEDGSGGLPIWHFGSGISGGCLVVLLFYLYL